MKSDKYEAEGAVERPRQVEEAAVMRFARVMCEKLRANARKPHWGSTPTTYLFMRLLDEVKELEQALVGATGVADCLEIERECADVANVSMMIWDILVPTATEKATDPATAERERICALLLNQAKGLREVAEREFEGHPGLKNEQRIKARALSDVVYDIRETAAGGRFG